MEDYICYDRKIEPSEEIKKMSKEQKEAEFQRLFGKYVDEDEEDE